MRWVSTSLFRTQMGSEWTTSHHLLVDEFSQDTNPLIVKRVQALAPGATGTAALKPCGLIIHQGPRAPIPIKRRSMLYSSAMVTSLSFNTRSAQIAFSSAVAAFSQSKLAA